MDKDLFNRLFWSGARATLIAAICTILWVMIIWGVMSIIPKEAHAEVINMDAIMQIESSGNPRAYNPNDGARGLFQITKIVLTEYNKFNRTSHTPQDLYNPEINKRIGTWYMTVRIRQMLKCYRLPLTTENYIIAWNAGIKNAIKGRVPKITQQYLRKYAKLTKGK